ncbi:DnaJ C-terminal domain-containing protein [Neorhizobium galegae]|uniref:DnaJ family molecular chaperone n=2 Tax=Neorhizobium galegae TaxID=399 RepID=A0A068SKS4_NEOGA|nr:DnaJ C-terminal domain-containing protein [Neorhizobium galegae]KAB1085542.1 J domain-containing protein [Neorhizobium galegae]CDN46743.1 DnaJ family molecular chaperone [Neorhizobium galegae bv. orientalis str. HAMBI 540]CDZ44377.1 DnaJ family molecular chaperone [Neorhizobium galegae bv. orientalis]
MRDPYSLLGVQRNAEPDEIKAAWRAKAKTVHPDQNQDDPSATSRFAEIGQAYEVLKDPERRKRYDRAAEMHQTIMQQRNAAREAAERAKVAKANAEKVMEELAKTNAQNAKSQAQPQAQARGQSQAQSQAHPQNQSGPAGETPEDMIERIFGAAAADQAKAQAGGSAQPNGDTVETAKADPSGGERPPLPALAIDLIASIVRRFRGTTPAPEKAPDISVEATVTVEDLLKLNTITLKMADDREVRLALERGMTEGHVARLKGQGLKLTGMKSGDLLASIKIARDSHFRVEGFDLHTTLSISLEDAVLGGDASVETPEGNRSISIPAWSGSDQTIRLEGLGLHDDAGGRGDLVVELRVVLWEKPNEKVTDLMRHMRHGLYV